MPEQHILHPSQHSPQTISLPHNILSSTESSCTLRGSASSATFRIGPVETQIAAAAPPLARACSPPLPSPPSLPPSIPPRPPLSTPRAGGRAGGRQPRSHRPTQLEPRLVSPWIFTVFAPGPAEGVGLGVTQQAGVGLRISDRALIGWRSIYHHVQEELEERLSETSSFISGNLTLGRHTKVTVYVQYVQPWAV